MPRIPTSTRLSVLWHGAPGAKYLPRLGGDFRALCPPVFLLPLVQTSLAENLPAWVSMLTEEPTAGFPNWEPEMVSEPLAEAPSPTKTAGVKSPAAPSPKVAVQSKSKGRASKAEKPRIEPSVAVPAATETEKAETSVSVLPVRLAAAKKRDPRAVSKSKSAPNPAPAPKPKFKEVSKAQPGRQPVPSILLESDLEPMATAPSKVEPDSALPEAYGTGLVSLTASDPHWFYASWDLTTEQMRRHRKRSREGYLFVRLLDADQPSSMVTEVSLPPDARGWFLRGGQPGHNFFIQLGYNDAGGKWVSIGTSRPIRLPWAQVRAPASVPAPTPAPGAESVPEAPAVVSPADSEMSRTIAARDVPSVAPPVAPVPAEETWVMLRPAPERTAPVQDEFPSALFSAADSVPVPAEAPRWESAPGYFVHPAFQVEAVGAPRWMPEQARALEEYLDWEMESVTTMNSAELVRRQRKEARPAGIPGPGPEATGPRSWVVHGPGAGVDSLSGIPLQPEGEGQRGFWFMVNAELIVYGATEPGAEVVFAGETIALRPDGTFSARFALPDGRYHLPITAISPDRMEARHAGLRFTRQSELQGVVGVHPQDPALAKPPGA